MLISVNSKQMDALLEVRNLEKVYDEQPVLADISFRVSKGEILALLGPSGCGKTTLLRLIAGLEHPTRGALILDEIDLQQIPVHKRRFGMVFQEYALFPHKNVAQNVEFGLRMLGWPAGELKRRVAQVLDLVGLSGFEYRQVYELSGGEQQRVALARSLAPKPRLLLLDEPLGSLDRALRDRLMLDLRDILKQADAGVDLRRETGQAVVSSADGGANAGVTSIYVTHDQEEAFAVADRVAVMMAGVIEQIGTPLDLYRRPRTARVARFLGMENVLPCRIITDKPLQVETEIGDFHVRETDRPIADLRQLLIRPEAASLAHDSEVSGNTLDATLESISFRGRLQIAALQVPGAKAGQKLKLTFDSSTLLPEPGSTMTLALDPSELLLLE